METLTKTEIYDPDGDGRESVSEYIEKKKTVPNATENNESEEKQKREQKSKEELQKVKNVAKGVGDTVGNIASVVSAVPKTAAVGLGAGFAGLAKILSEWLEGNNGESK